jgi:hypothetical protein
VGPGAVLDDLEKRKFLPLRGLELRHLSHPARSQSLYRLRYHGSNMVADIAIIRLERHGIRLRRQRKMIGTKTEGRSGKAQVEMA